MDDDRVEAILRAAINQKLLLGARWAVAHRSPAGVRSGRHAAYGSTVSERPAEVADLVPLYCTAKPLTAWTVAALVSEGRLALDQTVGSVVPTAHRGFGAVTIAELLQHRSGVHQPDAARALLGGRHPADAALGQAPRPPAERNTHYTEVAEWAVLGAVTEACGEQSIDASTASRILDPLGLADEFSLGDDHRERRIATALVVDDRVRPQLLERTVRLDFARAPGIGGFGSVRGLAALLIEVVSAVHGASNLPVDPATARRLLTPPPDAWDEYLQRPCRHNGGFLFDANPSVFGPAVERGRPVLSGIAGALTAATLDDESGVTAIVVHVDGWDSDRHPDLVADIWGAIALP